MSTQRTARGSGPRLSAKLPTPLPCPFCGDEPELVPYSVTRRGAKWHIGCTNNGCHAGPGLVAPTRKHAIGRWNSRSDRNETGRD